MTDAVRSIILIVFMVMIIGLCALLAKLLYKQFCTNKYDLDSDTSAYRVRAPSSSSLEGIPSAFLLINP